MTEIQSVLKESRVFEPSPAFRQLARFADALPKTRSGKIMRRLLRDIASGEQTPPTLEGFSVLAKLREEEE